MTTKRDDSAFADQLGMTAKHVSIKKPWLLLFGLLLVSYLVIILSTFLDYGITYDEEWHSQYGEYIIRWYTSLFQDKNALTYWTLPLQGGFFDATARAATYLSPFGTYESIHLVNALFGLLGVVAVYKLGSFLASPLAGFLSALFLILTPRFYGHSFNNPKDIPMAVLSTFVVYYLVRAIPYLPRIPKGLFLKLGVSLGLVLAVRTGAVILIGYIGIVFVLWMVNKHFSDSGPGQRGMASRSDFWALSKTLIVVCLVAYFVMLAWWPAAQVQPIKQPVKSLLAASNFEHSIAVYFDGATISNKDLPWYYLVKWFLITLPEFYLFALAVGLIGAGATLLLRRVKFTSLDRDRALGVFIILFGIAFPLSYTVILQPTDYDGIRHFLFVVPLLAVVAALSVTEILSRAVPAVIKAIVMILISSSALVTVVDMIQLHPYQYVYFNRMLGKGLGNAAKSFETEYWGSSYKEGVEWLVNNYGDENKDRKVKVVSCLYALSTSYYLPEDRFEYLGTFDDGKEIPEGAKPDIFLATTRWQGHKRLEGKVLHEVSRKNVPLLYIIEVSHDHSDNVSEI
ncbi:MAG: glycosyltransferase family 39 protein [Planctomycetota bacterium]|jgi:4-amino-4-deoxy-L-arabinose transferase-like glycosyltransferase